MLYLVRHGESEWNAAQRVQGQTAHPRLTHLGRTQAQRAAELIHADLASGQHPALALLTSDLKRAVETADIIGHHLQLSPTTDQRLREQHLGELQGELSVDAARTLDDVDWSDAEVPIGGGESVGQVYQRMASVLGPIRLDTSRTTIVVSHGDAIRLALGWIAGHGPVEAPWPTIANGSVFAIVADKPARLLIQ